MKPADEEIRSRDKDLDWHRERRLKDAMDSETRPLIWKLRQADEIAQWLFVILFAMDVALAMLGHFIGWRPTLYILAFGVIAFRNWLARAAWSHLYELAIAWREQRDARPAPIPRPQITKADVMPEADTFDGLPIASIAADIADVKDGKITREVLRAIGVTRVRAAQELQDILKKSEFLLYKIGASPDAYATGAERIAMYGENNAITLHPTLLSSPAEDRALVIANAIRRTKKFTVDRDPQIQGEPTPAARLVYPSERVPRGTTA